MKYKEAIQFFEEIPYFTKDPSNDHIQKVLDKLGNPEQGMRFFHVAGTNGKGSVCSFLASILEKGGYKTALFTSPHLVKINERIKIDGRDISDENFGDYLERVKNQVEEPLSFFEYLFAMAMLYFKEQGVDYCVLETGLGGTYDSTNVVTPEISIITSIGMDHIKILGDTLEEIAGEKAGIIKPGKPIVFLEQEESVNQVIEEVARKNHSQIIRLSKDDIKILENHKKFIAFSIKNGYHNFDRLKIATIAHYQVWNAYLSVIAIKCVLPELEDEVIRRGIESMVWPARMEEIRPGVFLDGAHNPPAIHAFVETVKAQFVSYRKDLLFAVVADKDYEEMIRVLCEGVSFEHITITCIPGARKADSSLVESQFLKYTVADIEVEEDIETAYKKAMQQKREYLFCLGSLYLAGKIETLLC